MLQPAFAYFTLWSIRMRVRAEIPIELLDMVRARFNRCEFGLSYQRIQTQKLLQTNLSSTQPSPSYACLPLHLPWSVLLPIMQRDRSINWAVRKEIQGRIGNQPIIVVPFPSTLFLSAGQYEYKFSGIQDFFIHHQERNICLLSARVIDKSSCYFWVVQRCG